MFDTKETIAIKKKMEIYKKLREQETEIRAREEQQQKEKAAIDAWWEAEKKKIVPWTDEQRADYEKHTFDPRTKYGTPKEG
jgi:hypothetical protein